MSDLVDQTLQHWRQTSFEWGQSDCLLSLADYLVSFGLEDFGTFFRNSYDTEQGAKDHIANWGGEENLMNTTGLGQTETPQRGDLVLVQMGEKIAGLCTGQNIAFRNPRSVIEINMKFVKVLKAWKVEKCQL